MQSKIEEFSLGAVSFFDCSLELAFKSDGMPLRRMEHLF